ncbi:hypothetical protein AB0D46_14975, partial [Streptomyces sp. NPDC048383]
MPRPRPRKAPSIARNGRRSSAANQAGSVRPRSPFGAGRDGPGPAARGTRTGPVVTGADRLGWLHLLITQHVA